MAPIGIGIIGCGDISDSYFGGAARSALMRIKACADLCADAAAAKATTYGVEVLTVERMLADPGIEIVLNLTVPLAHATVSGQIVAAGKHVYSEKPLAARFADAKALLAAAEAKGVRVGSAPDTFMGAGHQACRRSIDDGRIGRPIAGAATMISHGMEHWHPNPEFFFKPGGGPMLDVGPYYVTQLVNLLGPVARVTAEVSRGFATRTVSSEPRAGQVIEVEVPTTVNGVLAFEGGANVALTTSWDVWKHQRRPFEIYGTEGSMLVPDPNFFGGEPLVSAQGADWQPLDIGGQPFGTANRTLRSGARVADYRIIGLLDMAMAVRHGRPHRASGALALHVLEVLEAFGRASEEGRHIRIQSPVERPEPVPPGAGEAVFGG